MKQRTSVGITSCPRRDDIGPWEHGEGLDQWEMGWWAATKEDADAEVAEFMARHPGGSIGHILWDYPGEQPRTCSFCGGVHPEDAVALLKAGWRVERTTKTYKRYMEPPLGYPSPVPPVKLYVYHFSEEQAAEFNQILRNGQATL